ncbi:MAG: hypothetical protein Q9168_004357 [Polycauliona sp. 1 TL-2023]
MRLLHASTFRLESFIDEESPPYAILSHTWGAQEITLQQLERQETVSQLHAAKSSLLDGNSAHRDREYRQGCLKIAGCALQAEKDGFEYIWCDTCCIDKTNSTELSEAINSMYSWYKDQLCYAYLADVHSEDHSSSEARDSAFSGSRWFTRDWTLQELIAPSSLIFFDAKWQSIGTRSERQDLIARRTNIDKRVLKGGDPLRCSVANRMSWASKRQTTRVEDLAYCLLGLFEVNMPLIYGEKHKAFLRLQTEIMRVSEDHSLFAWKSPESVEGTDGCGLLAGSPVAFARSHCIVPSIPYQSNHQEDRPPPSMTSRGVHILLPLLPVPIPQTVECFELFFATLDCHDTTNTRGPLGIYLMRAQYGQSYRRWLPWRLVPVDDAEDVTGESTLKTLYVSQHRYMSRFEVSLQFFFHISELPEELSEKGAFLKVIPNDAEDRSTFWDEERSRLILSQGLGASIFLGLPNGWGKLFLLGIDSDVRAKCVIATNSKGVVTDRLHEGVTRKIYMHEQVSYWKPLNDLFHNLVDDQSSRDFTLHLRTSTMNHKDNPKIYERRTKEVREHHSVLVHMDIDASVQKGEEVYLVSFRKQKS